MENTEVQQKAAALSGQFRMLAKNFREIDPAGGYQRVIDLAGYGAKLCKQAHDAGLLELTGYKREVALLTEWASSPQEDLQSWIRDLLLKEYGEIPDQPLDALNEIVEPRLDDSKMWPSMDLADMWAGTWRAIVSHLCTNHPDELPCNPFVDNRYLAYCGVQAPRNAKTEWRSLAQNYAMVAEWLAVVMDGDKKEDGGAKQTTTVKNRPGKRGPKQSHDHKQEAKIARDWKTANNSGVFKVDFAREKGFSLKDFDRLLNRVRKAAKKAKS